MKRITVQMDVLLRKDLKEYLLTIAGVIDANIDFEEESINITYDEKITNSKILKMELYFFFERKYSSIVSFDKYGDKVQKLDIVIEDMCCENCYCNLLDELFEIDGIEKVNSDYDTCSTFRNLHLFIEYDEDKISLEYIKEVINNY